MTDLGAAPEELAGRVVVVTGGSRGIGAEIVRQAAARGAAVAFCGRTLGPEAESVREEASRAGRGGQVIAVRADVSQEDDVAALFDSTVRAFGRIDIIINNAGISRDILLVSMPLSMWDKVIATNLTGPFLVARQAVRELVAQGRGGRIVTVGSVQQEGAPSNASYAASKGGLIGLTRAIAYDYGRYGIGAYLAVVGAVETELTSHVPEALKRGVINACPQRREATLAEVAAAVLFIASPRAALRNGSAVRVAGGLLEIPA